MIPLLSAIAAGGSALNTWMQSRSQKKRDERQNKENRELQEYQYSKDLEIWNKGNVYNSPTAQMDRLKSAGLNPNLVYGSGGGATQAAQLPKYNAPTMSYSYQPPIDVPSMIGMFQDIQIKNAEIDNLKAQHENILNTSNLKSIMGDVKGQERDWLKGMGMYQTEGGPDLKDGATFELRPRGMALLDTQLSSKQQGLKNLEKQYGAIIAGTNQKNAAAAYTREQTNWLTGNAIIKLLGPWIGKMIPGAGTIGARGARGTFNQKYK